VSEKKRVMIFLGSRPWCCVPRWAAARAALPANV
jgi:hypothetical protein